MFLNGKQELFSMAEQPRKVGVYDRVRETATHRRGGVPSRILKKRRQSPRFRSGTLSNEVRQGSNPVGGDAEAIAEVGPEGDGVLLAGFLERQEGVAASSAVLAAGAAADLAEGHRVADILLRAV